MKSALFGALMLSSQLTRAEEMRYSICEFMASGDWTTSDPEITGFLLMHEGENDTSPVIRGVLTDYNIISDDN